MRSPLFLTVVILFSFTPLLASAVEYDYTAAQCTAIGGRPILNVNANTSDCAAMDPILERVGTFRNDSCVITGICCAQIATPPTGGACGAQTCAATGGQCRFACGTGEMEGGGTCSSGKCCIPGGGGTCASLGGVCRSSVCSAELRKASSGSCSTAGESCCTTTTFPVCASPKSCASDCGIGTEDRSSLCTDVYKKCCAPATSSGGGVQTSSGGNTGQGVAGQGVGLINPLKAGTNLKTFLGNILDFVISIGTIVVILMIVFVGFKFVTARGEPGEITKAREMLLWTVIGALVLLGAKAIQLGIVATVEALSS